METKDKILQIILFELLFSNPQNREYTEGLTAIELSKKYNLKMSEVKKKLKLLQEKEIVRAVGVNPKFWIFDEYKFKRLNEDDPIHYLMCNTEDIDFDSFFNYG